MRCKDIREQLDELWTGNLGPEVREHLAACRDCEGYLHRVKLVRAGLQALAEEPVPEPSLGFASRLVRRWGESAQEGARHEFWERVGRRFVFAALAVTLGLLLALLLPSSGPVRGLATPDLLMAQTDTITGSPDPLAEDLQVNQSLPPESLPGEGGNGKP